MELVRWCFSHLFPSRCILCQQTVLQAAKGLDIEVCADCYQALPHNVHRCMQCALPLPVEIETDVLCGRCIKTPPAFDYTYSLFSYEREIIRLVHQLKFADKFSYARSIGELLFATFNEQSLPENGRPDCIIPVPLHNRRLRQRGYNQSLEIVRVLGKRTAITIDQQAVTRRRSTVTQTGLKAEQRRKNIKGAFQVVKKLGYHHVLIVDDVITTGSTVNELAKVLKQSGVERVGVLSIARAPMKT
jgi:ComF family protein